MASVVVNPAVDGDDCHINDTEFWDTSYCILGNSGPDNTTFIRFPNVLINTYATISAAVLKVYSVSNYSSAGVKVRSYGNYIANAIAPTNRTQALALAKTTAHVDWSIGTWTTDLFVSAPDITTIIQEIINRSDWSSGNALQLIMEDNGSTGGSWRALKANTAGKRAELTITFTEPAVLPFKPKFYLVL